MNYFTLMFQKTEMLPVRCFTCNKVLGNKERTFKTLQEKEVPMKKIWENLGLSRFCCQMIMLSHVDLTDQMMAYSDYKPSKYVEIRKQQRLGDQGGGDQGGGEAKVVADFANMKISASKPRIYDAV